MEQLNATLIHTEHVLGYQDDNLDIELSWNVQLNVYCDQLATIILQQQDLPSDHVPFLPASIISLTIQNCDAITHHIPTQIRWFYGRQLQKPLLCALHSLLNHQFDNIEWD